MLDQFFDEPEDELNEHEIAWLSKDWDAVQKLADQYKEKQENVLFSILDSITVNKNEMTTEQENQYSKYWIDNALSQHVDCIIPVYTMNLIGESLSDEDHFRYYKNAISSGKRYGKWAKLVDDSEDLLELSVLREHYNINIEDAIMYRTILKAKNNFGKELKRLKSIATDDFIKTVIKNKADHNKLIKKVKAW